VKLLYIAVEKIPFCLRDNFEKKLVESDKIKQTDTPQNIIYIKTICSTILISFFSKNCKYCYCVISPQVPVYKLVSKKKNPIS
jgi:hypothetical protein